ncbi:unnamed protein product [Euphydryas editha]|uniref:GAG-pre-integrase domain-containing protein n=1 Tax=Euphydryas editha TaxID=104508 RepID=A0AAU9TW17_EUPED|nr:unnamed protein product [Euphydryas editha]
MLESPRPLDESSLTDMDHDYNQAVTSDAVQSYIAGYIVRKLRKTIKCEICLEAIETHAEVGKQLQRNDVINKMDLYGGLRFASNQLFDLTKQLENCVLRAVSKNLTNVETISGITMELRKEIVLKIGCFQHENSLTAKSLQGPDAALMVSTKVWHRRLGHLSFRGMCSLKNLVSGVMFLNQRDVIDENFVSCVEGMLAAKAFSKVEAKRAKQMLELIHSDRTYWWPHVCTRSCLPVCTRPDISYALSQLSQFNKAFTKDHWLAAKRILRYLSSTIDYDLVYVKTDEESAVNIEKEIHLRKADLARDGMKNDTEYGKILENDTSVIAFDLMKTLPTPHIATGVAYYKRQL